MLCSSIDKIALKLGGFFSDPFLFKPVCIQDQQATCGKPEAFLSLYSSNKAVGIEEGPKQHLKPATCSVSVTLSN